MMMTMMGVMVMGFHVGGILLRSGYLFIFCQAVPVYLIESICGIISHNKFSSEGVTMDDRSKALSAALAQIERQFGKGSVMRLGDTGAIRDIDVISTGSLGLDMALGVGGLPRG